MTIVYARPPKRSPRKRKTGPQPTRTIVIAKEPVRQRTSPEGEQPADPEADAKIKAFFKRMVRPPEPRE